MRGPPQAMRLCPPSSHSAWLQLTDGGCELSSDRSGHEVEVLDARKLRRSLEQKLTLNAELRGAFMEGLAAELQDCSKLHAFLRPMTVTSHVSHHMGLLLACTLLQLWSVCTGWCSVSAMGGCSNL